MQSNKLQLYFAIALLTIIILASIFAPLLSPYNPLEPDMTARLQPPSWSHLFGTDVLGRDMFSRILYGGRASMLLALAASLISLGVGVSVGTLGGYYGGKFDVAITIVSNIFQGIPGTCFMIAIAGIFGSSISSLLIALVITSWAGFSRIVRAEVLQLKQEAFIEGLHCLGCSDFRILVRHILPNIFNKLLALFTIRISRSILSVAALSFLGLGVQPPTPDWSVMVNEATLYYRSSPHTMIIPGLCIFLLIYSLNTLGELLRNNLDVRSNEVRKW